MSVSRRISLVLGFHLPEIQAQVETKSRGCRHPEVAGAKFCPECGKPTWKKEVKELTSLGSAKFAVERNNTADFEYEDQHGVVVGRPLPISASTGNVIIPQQEQWPEIEREIKQVLADYGIAPKGPFGVYMARYVN